MNQISLLAQRRFGPLFATQFLGAFNDNVYKNALVIFIAFSLADRLGANSSQLVILAAGIFILPFFLFSASAGQIADKYEKSGLIRRIKIAEIMIMSAGLLGFLTENIYLLMGVLFFMGTQSTVFGPLKYGILPQHLDESELTGGNGMIQMGTFLAILFGTMTGGVLVALPPYGPVIVASAAVLIAVCGWLASGFIPPAAPSDPDTRIRVNLLAATVRVIRFSLERISVFIAILAISWFWLVGATFLSLVPAYTRDVLNGNEHVATLLLTAFSIGVGSGSVSCEKLSRGHIEIGLVPIGAAGISLFALDLWLLGDPSPAIAQGDAAILGAGAFLSHLVHWHVLLDLVLIGAFGGIYIVPLYAFVQHYSEAAHRARIIAANNILNAAFMVLSAVVTLALLQAGTAIAVIFLLVGLSNTAVAGAIFAMNPEFISRCRAWCCSWIRVGGREISREADT